MVINKKISITNRTVMSNKNNKYIVIHYVGAVSTAKANASYFYSTYRGASAHYFVDDTSIWQAVLDKNAAWQCGGGSQGSGGKKFFGKCKNSNSIGIEMCCKKKSGKLYITDKTIENTAVLVKKLMKKYNIPASNVIRHYDVTGKNCPAPYISEKKWVALHKKLTDSTVKETDQVNASTTTTTATQSQKLTAPTVTLQKGDIGAQVKRLQNCLNKIMNLDLKVDGSFGSATLDAVKRFQKKYALTVDGSVGPKTRAKIKSLI